MTDYYLAVSGRDSDDGLSAANAWGTFEHALDNLSAGDTLYIAPGVHLHDQAARDNVGGTSGSPIVFQGDPYGEHFPGIAPSPVCFTNQQFDFTEAQVTGRLFWWEQDSKFFEFHNCVFIAGGNDITETMMYFGEGVGAFGMDGIVFEDCMFFNKNTDETHQLSSLVVLDYGDGDTPVGDGARFRRCWFDGDLTLESDDNAVANFDIDVVIESCVFNVEAEVRNSGDNGTYNITGITLINCTQLHSGTAANQLYSVDYPRGGAATQLVHSSISQSGSVIKSTAAGDTGCVEANYVEAIWGGQGLYSGGGGTTGSWGDGVPPGSTEFSWGPMMGYEANWIWEKYFGFRPFLMHEPLHLFGLKNQAIGKGNPDELLSTGDFYGRPYDKNKESYVWSGFFNGDYTLEPWNSQQFTSSDPDSAWTGETSINENITTQFASCSTNGDIANNYLLLQGTAVNLDTNQVIHKVYVRPFIDLDGANTKLKMNFYTAAEAEDLGTLTFADDTASGYEVWEGPRWYPLQEITAPAGGWTVAAVQGLEAKVWAADLGTVVLVYRISFWIDSGNHDAGAVRAQGPRDLEETIVNDSPTSVKLVRGGMYQTTIPCVKNTQITVSADMYKDANYAGNAPLMEVFNIPGGVALQSAQLSAAAEAWGYVSVSFTPTQNGMATIRFRSQCTAVDGNCYFDNLAYV